MDGEPIRVWKVKYNRYEREKSKKMLRTAYDVLSTLGIYPCDIMVTGSIALDIYGLLPDDRTPGDVDVIIKNVDERTKAILGVIQATNDVPSDYKDESGTFFKFIVSGVVMNIWVQDFEKANTCCHLSPVGYIWVSPIKDILDKKRSYGRKKDYQDIAAIAAGILKK